jgi:3',5'-cyclic AMP phosphodiesterase CpdA
MLDSNRYDDARQLAWLDADLAAARRAGTRAIFAVTHHGPWARGPHGGDETAARDYAPILEKHEVAMIFSGHDHIYQRGQVGKLRYMVSGGGGAALYQARCGIKGKKKCAVDDGMKKFSSEHHYIAVEVYRDYATLCPRRPDRTAIDDFITIRLD